MKKTIAIDGDNIRDISSFYEEINRVFMANENWKLGPNLDALNDLLYGGFGAINGNEPVALVWLNMEKNRADLGLDLTRTFYRDKLRHPETYDSDRIGKDLAALENGTGETYFEIVLQIIADHPNIELLAC
ncbi:barstar family protein [Rhizobium puerariae]|uniref:Barstar family protein n=1 Tax=Rhizobium puerariae TaxID=1585791 RepID=A0ABV6AHJ8_9HYPH